MLKKDNIKINFNKFEEEFKVENIEDMYVGTGEYKGSIEYALFIKCSDGLYPRLYLVFCKSLLRCIPVDVGEVDISPSANWPDSGTWVEISGADLSVEPAADGDHRSI